jgi:RES domain-containing protein
MPLHRLIRPLTVRSVSGREALQCFRIGAPRFVSMAFSGWFGGVGIVGTIWSQRAANWVIWFWASPRLTWQGAL